MKNEKISQFLKRRSKMEDDETEQVPAAQEILPPSYHIAKTIQDLLALGLGIFTIYTCITGLWTLPVWVRRSLPASALSVRAPLS